MSGFEPINPKTLAERPLDKGVILSVPPQGMPVGSFLDLTEYLTTPRGLLRLGNISEFQGGAIPAVDYPPVTGIWKLWTTEGSGYVVVTDRKFMYVVTDGTLTGKYDTYETGTVTVTDDDVVGDETSWATDIEPGDIMVLDADGDGDGPEDAVIETVTDGTNIVLVAAPTGTYGAETDYAIRKAFRTNHPMDRSETGTTTLPADGSHFRRLQAVVADNEIVFVDGTRYPRSFDGSDFGQFGSLTIVPRTIAYFRDRLYFGYIENAAVFDRYQMQWSDVGSGSLSTVGASSYQSLPYSEMGLKSLVTMGGNLVAFFGDAVYIGTPTNSPSVPVDFDQVSTGGIGLVGTNAWAPGLDGLFYVGQKDIYYLSQQGYEAIGTPVLRRTIETCAYPEFIDVCADPVRKRIVFSFPKSSWEGEELWSFQWETKAWSREVNTCTALGLLRYETTYTINGLDGLAVGVTTNDLSTYYATIDEMGSREDPDASLYLGTSGGEIYVARKSGSEKHGSFTTKDLEYNAPDTKKAFTKFNLRIDRELSDTLNFRVELSHDQGRTWKNCGTLSIPSGDTEGKVNFRSVGTVARFKVKQTTATDPYVIEEYSVRVRPRGKEDTYV
jgi:hypothetical protein